MANKLSRPVLSIILTNISEEPYQELCQSVANYFEDNGWYVLIFNAFTEVLSTRQYLHGYSSIFHLVNYELSDAVLMFEPTIQDPDTVQSVYDNCRLHKVPLIVSEGSRTGEGIYHVHSEYEGAFSRIVEHLIVQHNCRTINMLAGQKGNFFSEQRIAEYRKALERHNIPFEEDRVYYGDFWSVPAKAATQQMLMDSAEYPDAIVCANDTMAMTVCEVLNEHGLSVPDDIMVTGFDGIEAEQFHSPRLTTAAMDIPQLVKTIYRMASDLQQGYELPSRYIVPLTVRFSQSCGCNTILNRDANKKLTAIYDKFDMINDFIRFANEMAIDMAQSNSVEETITNIRQHAYQQSHICVFPDYAEDLNSEIPSDFPDRMIHLGHRNSELDLTEYDGTSFATKDLLPDLEKTLQITAQLLFCSIYRRDDVIGYYCLPAFRQYGLNYEHLSYFMLFLTDGMITARNTTKMHYLMTRDTLTGLYNRRGFYQSLARFLTLNKDRHFEPIVFSIDLDHLKTINDTYGHEEGDVIIKAGADAIAACAKVLGKKALCARFGGDEFVLVHFAPENGANIAAQIRDQLNQTIETFNSQTDKPYRLEASIGFETANSLDDFNIDQMLSTADKQMYSDKQHHKRLRQL